MKYSYILSTAYPCIRLLSIYISIFLLAIIKCADVAPVITQSPITASSDTDDIGTLYPSIQLVYPGTLQTLDIPQSYPTDINYLAADIVVVFSHEMENDNDEMPLSFLLYEDSSLIATSVSPDSTSSKQFVITKSSGEFKPNSIYSLRIYKYAHINDAPDRSLNFDNLIEPPASTLSPVNPEYVKYIFRTGSAGVTDTQPPVILYTSPSDGETNVDPTLSPGGYIEIIFSDNCIPMIYPPTVNIATITLENITESLFMSTRIEFDTSDYDFKTFHLYPLDNLVYGRQYRITISVGNSIEDFQSNIVNETAVYFTTSP
ncbi:MAG: Ig-like domain-containing protein [Spirochaetota bacterium]|nr:Ig-like domain-containing protein [Spirochaetota bacterium]